MADVPCARCGTLREPPDEAIALLRGVLARHGGPGPDKAAALCDPCMVLWREWMHDKDMAEWRESKQLESVEAYERWCDAHAAGKEPSRPTDPEAYFSDVTRAAYSARISNAVRRSKQARGSRDM